MHILGIESSCDDTSVALLNCSDTQKHVLAEKTASQVAIHEKYGGVVPEVAGRQHAEHILPVIEEVMKNQEKPDAIAVTAGPGLMTGLLVGTEAAKALSYLWDVPLIATNHIDGHIHSVEIGAAQAQITFPALCLIVSGGHTELVLMHDHDDYELLGKTRDDAAGEAFDKVGKLLDIPYPGGPKISQLAENGDPTAIDFPRPMLDRDNYDFSFAGLKTAALYWLRDNTVSPPLEGEDQEVITHGNKNAAAARPPLTPPSKGGEPHQTLEDICASFEQAIVDVLVKKTARAAQQYQPTCIILGGGVSANKKLRNTLVDAISDTPVLLPAKGYSMDNGAMIAAAGYYRAKQNEFTDWRNLAVDPNWKIYAT